MPGETLICGPDDARIHYSSGSWTRVFGEDGSTVAFTAGEEASVIFDFDGKSTSLLLPFVSTCSL